MKSEKRKKGKPARQREAQRARSPKPISMRRSSPSPTTGFSIQPEDVSLTTERKRVEELDCLRRRIAELEAMEAEYKRIEQELKLRDQILEKIVHILESAIDPIFIHDAEGNFIYVNEAAARSHGYTKEELMKMDLYKLEVARPSKMGEARMKKILEDRSAVFEVEHYHKDDSLLHFEIHTRPVEMDGNLFFISAARDISERKRAEEALRRSEQNFRDSMENSPFGIRVLDKDGKTLYANRAMLDIWGYSSVEGLEAAPRKQRYTPESYSEHMERLKKRKRGEPVPISYDTSIVRSDGQVRHLSASRGEVLWNGEKRFQMVYQDITERKRVEEALRDREARFRYLFEYSQVANALVGLDGKIIDVNQAAAELYGYDKSEIIGMDLLGFITPESKAKVAEAFASGLVHAHADPVEVEVAAKGGMRTFFFPGGYHMLFEGGKETGFLISAIDVTERKQAEERMKHLNLVLRAIRNVNQLIARGADRDTLLKGVCENFVMTRGYHNAWVALLDESGKLVTAVEAGLGKDFLQMIERLKRGELPDCGRKALKKSGVVVIEDPSSACTDCPLAKDYPGRGGMAVRLEYGGKVYGLVTVSTPLSYLDQKEELDLFEEVAGDIAFALYSMEQEEERKRAEEALAEEAIRRRILMDQSRDGISILDENSKLYEANQRFAEMLGYTPKELRELHSWDWDTQWTREELLEMGRSVDEAGAHLETRHRRKDGTVFDVELSVNSAVVAGKKLLFCVSRDITERKRAEEALRLSEQNFRDSIESSPLGIRVLGKDGKTLYANRALLDMWGYSSIEEMEAVPKKQRYTSDSYAAHMERSEKRKRGEYDSLSYETSIVRGDGQVRHLSVSRGELLWNGEKQFQLVYQDITERKQIEKELRTSHGYLDRILNSMVEVLMVVDTDYNIININRSFLEYYGGKRRDIIGRKCYEVLHMLSEPCSAAQRRCPLQTVLRTGRPFHAEHTYETVEGQELIFEVSMFPLVGSAGNIEAVVEMQHDITESKRAEEERGQLEQKAQLASRLASVGEMAAGIAHEINNPLTSVIGYSQLLSDRDDISEDVRMDLKAIDEGAQRVAGIIKRLLTFARQTRPERTLASVNELITNTLDLRAYHLRTNNIKVTTELATDLPITTADPAQLQQVFLNIIVNAETAMKLARGKGKLLIKTEEVNGTIRISFKDNGPGIARENLARIFDPFFTTREVGQGTGLGLSICHGIIAEHKGRIWVESEMGKGSTFIMELPIVIESTRLEVVEPAGKKPQKVPRAKILVVDDEPSTLEFLSRLLTNEGHEVDTVGNATEAFEMVKNKRYSLILLDIKMPGASGIELYGRMQKIAQSFAERVIFITGDIMGTDTEAFLSRTKAPYLTKPFDVNQLKKKIEHFLTGGQ